MEDKKMLNVVEVVQTYGLAKGTLNNLRSWKRGPKYYKVGKRVLYKPADVERWIERHPVMTVDAVE